MPSDVVPLRNRMTVEDYTKRRAEQELARLFHDSGWTLKELAEREGLSKIATARLMVFGRFLDFASATAASESQNSLETLNERHFRKLFQQADHSEVNERIRFRAVLKLLADRVQS